MAQDDRARDAQVALTRFGLGSRPGEPAGILGDPRGFVLSQLAVKDAAAIAGASPSAATILRDYQRALPKLSQRKKRMKPGAPDPTVAPAQQYYRNEIVLRAAHAVATETPFVERLVMFWSNFFAVSAEKNVFVRSTVGAYEREAIRPHVLGRFVNMLTAATRHPVMLTYLDNNKSVGPKSRGGRRRGVGLNENLARETLELHSLGVDGGYTQADVTALARIITGWRTATDRDRAKTGSFMFDAGSHEPGDHTVLGRTYMNAGVKQGEAVLADLARHPSTAKFVALRLAQHFVSDAPPPALVERLAKAFRDTDGNLRKVAEALASAPSAWVAAPQKFLPPYDFLVAAHRLTDSGPEMPQFHEWTTRLGQPAWNPGSPKGWPDSDAYWMAPDGLLARLEWASLLAERVAGTRDIVELASAALGPRLAGETRTAIARADSRVQGLSLLLASSEFQTR